MSRLRALLVVVCAIAWTTTACGEDPSGGNGTGTGHQGGAGGTGGDEAPGGTGGEDDGLPAVQDFFPSEAGRGFRIRVRGRNFHPAAPRNSVLFSREGGSVPNLEAKGVASGSDGSWFEVTVPKDAVSGPTRIVVDRSDGTYTLEGPAFTVTDATLPPSLSAVEPEALTIGKSMEFTVTGKDFYLERTMVLVGGKPATVDWSRSSETTLLATVPDALQGEPGQHQVFVENPQPGGGKAGPKTLRLVEGLRVISVEAVAPRELRVQFDRAVMRQSLPGAFSIAGVSNAVQDSQRSQQEPSLVRVFLNVQVEAGKTYTLVFASHLKSIEGGAILDDRKEFEGFDPRRALLEEIGGWGCGATGFADPTGISVSTSADRIYVLEREGNQVQVLDREGNFLGFFGDDGASFGYHTEGEEPSCAGDAPGPDALAAPIGTPVPVLGGGLVVGDTGNRRLVLFGLGDPIVLAEEIAEPSIAMGMIEKSPGVRGVAVATGAGKMDLFHPAEGHVIESVGLEPGTGRGQLDFRMDEGGIPAVFTLADDFSGPAYLIVEPGNHRISRWTVSRTTGRLTSSGSVGKGSDSFQTRDATGEPGTDPGTFTGPVGVAAIGSTLYVVDVAGGEDGGGRLQQISRFGRVNWVMPLDYEPGGIAADPQLGLVWITNRTRSTLMKYKF